ncbi:universal stress protein [Bounagaea algeriensis]
MAEGDSLVVGMDGSQGSMRALRWVREEGQQWARLAEVIMAWEPQAVLSGPSQLLRQSELAPHQARKRHWRDLVHAVRTCTAGASAPEPRMELIEGKAADVLADKSAHAVMLVLGDHGQGRASQVLLGSTALRCIHKAQCPVVITPTGMDSAWAEPEGNSD